MSYLPPVLLELTCQYLIATEADIVNFCTSIWEVSDKNREFLAVVKTIKARSLFLHRSVVTTVVDLVVYGKQSEIPRDYFLEFSNYWKRTQAFHDTQKPNDRLIRMREITSEILQYLSGVQKSIRSDPVTLSCVEYQQKAITYWTLRKNSVVYLI